MMTSKLLSLFNIKRHPCLMRLEKLPEEVTVLILSYLDSQSLYNVMKLSDPLSKIIARTPKLMDNLIYTMTLEKINKLSVTSLPSLPHRTLKFEKFTVEGDGKSVLDYDSFNEGRICNYMFTQQARIPRLPFIEKEKFFKILKNYEDSLETLIFYKVKFECAEMLEEVFKVTKIKRIIFQECCNYLKKRAFKDNKFYLEYLEFDNCEFYSYYYFFFNCAIKKLRINSVKGIQPGKAGLFISTLDNLETLILNGYYTGEVCCEIKKPVMKLKKLYCFLLTTNRRLCPEPRTTFLKSQVDTLTDLKIVNLPDDSDGDVVLKFILDNMKLKNFYHGNMPIILNGERQEVTDTWFSLYQVRAGMEMLRQFPTIENLILWIFKKPIEKEVVKLLLSENSTVFNSIKELTIIDNSDTYDYLTCIHSLVKGCQSLTKLEIHSDSDEGNILLRECLSHLPSLSHLRIYSEGLSTSQFSQFLRESSQLSNIKRYDVNAKVLKENTYYFRNKDVKVGVVEKQGKFKNNLTTY